MSVVVQPHLDRSVSFSNLRTTAVDPITVVREQIANGIAATKCHPCGCFHTTVEALASSELEPSLADDLAAARATFQPKKYDCLGCSECFPAIAANAVTGLDLCPVDANDERAGWPPLPGDYHVIRYGAPVAVCTLNSDAVAGMLAAMRPEGLAIAGTMHTENLGIERVIRNVNANPHIRFLILCGEDTRQSIGHLPGQSLESLFREGLDERQRIIGARGKRPVLKNVTREQVASFLRQVELVPMIGERDVTKLRDAIERLHAQRREPFAGGAPDAAMETIEAAEPARMLQDPAGYFVIYPDRARHRIVLEHYANDGVLHSIIEGDGEGAICATAIERGLLTRLDHATYLGRELALACRALETGEPYVQDRAPEQQSQPKATPCGSGCGPSCS